MLVYVQQCIDGDMCNVNGRKYIGFKTGDGDVVYMTSREDNIWTVIHYKELQVTVV
jgi:hypothetical protein